MIKNSLKNTFVIIKRNKSKLLIIFFLQMLWFIALTSVTHQTIIPATEHAKSLVDYYNNIDTKDPNAILGEDPLAIYKDYNKMLYYLKIMLLFVSLSFIIINGLIWALTDNLINKKKLKDFAIYLLNFSILTIFFALIIYIFTSNTLKSSLGDLLPLITIILLSILLSYSLFISYSLIGRRKLKEILKLTFKISIFKFHYVILVYIINLAIIFLLTYLISLTIELNIILLSALAVLLVFSFIFARLFLIIIINKLAKKIR
ncbi:MAG: hypothetical protein U9O94_07370 [Nanoarchaeota archaeon]|nr:hypothetical protein [Nanoarchaeota archaeon]